MTDILYIDRKTGKTEKEKVFGERAVQFLYSKGKFAKVICNLVSKNSFVSRVYGGLQKKPITARKIVPFIKKYEIDASEFEAPLASFRSFNDFFIRKLKKSARPIASSAAVMPADARYWFFENLDSKKPLLIKGQSFELSSFLGDAALAKQFEGASAVLARLCPSDYHRFHFPVDCVPGESKLISGPLFSVNPIATFQNLSYLTENKRKITLLESPIFGQIVYVEIGATNVGSIVETYTPNQQTSKGDEKGYFEFGGSALVILFQKGKISFSKDLLEEAKKGIEIRCLMGQPLGEAYSK